MNGPSNKPLARKLLTSLLVAQLGCASHQPATTATAPPMPPTEPTASKSWSEPAASPQPPLAREQTPPFEPDDAEVPKARHEYTAVKFAYEVGDPPTNVIYTVNNRYYDRFFEELLHRQSVAQDCPRLPCFFKSSAEKLGFEKHETGLEILLVGAAAVALAKLVQTAYQAHNKAVKAEELPPNASAVVELRCPRGGTRKRIHPKSATEVHDLVAAFPEVCGAAPQPAP
jgi:hypothetical protein